MDIEIPRRLCGVCARPALGRELPGNMGIYGAHCSWTMDSAHSVCVGKVIAALNATFPKLQLRVTHFEPSQILHALGCSHGKLRGCDKCALDEDNAIEHSRESGILSETVS